MFRCIVFGTALALTSSLTSAWSQQPAGGTAVTGAAAAPTAGATPQLRPGASAPSTAAMPGQSGTFSDFGPAAMQQGQFFPNGQPVMGPTAGVGQFSTSGRFFPGGPPGAGTPFGAPVSAGQFTGSAGQFTGSQFTTRQFVPADQLPPGGFATARFNAVFGNGLAGAANTSVFGSPVPWFSTAGVRQQLQLNPNQYRALYDAYVDANTSYNQAVAQLPGNLIAAERAGRIQALQEMYGAQFNQVLEGTLTAPQLRQRFNDLSAQYQQNSSRQPAGRAPSLSAEQDRRLRLMADQWNQLAQQLRQRQEETNQVFPEEVAELTAEAQKQIESTLTPHQQVEWQELVAPYYDFDSLPSLQRSSTSSEDQ